MIETARLERRILAWPNTDPTSSLPVDRPLIMGHHRLRAPVDEGDCIGTDTGAGAWPADG